MNRKLQTVKYLLADFFSAGIGWACFYSFRKIYIEPIKFGHPVPFEFGNRFYVGIFLVPFFWLLLYAITNTYKNVYRKSRLKELGETILISLIGVVILFFALILDDQVESYKTYYLSLFALFSFHLSFTFLCRFTLTSITVHRIQKKIIGFNTLIVGSDAKALSLISEMEKEKHQQGNILVGYVHVDQHPENALVKKLPHLGDVSGMKNCIREKNIEEVIIAIESSEHDRIGKIITELQDTGVIIKIIPDMYDILSGSVKMTAIFGAPLIAISPDLMPAWQQPMKRLIDILFSLIVLVLMFPVFFLTALGVLFSSGWPVFYSHERIGRHGKPFTIFKFRSMIRNAEAQGPTLSSEFDSRVTPFGRFMRRTRLDEIPQFYNVLVGDMSLVGPRPERQFFIDQIVKVSPHYFHLLKVKPGITSWGQVKYGYAENVDQMVARLKFDLMYIENISLMLDLKILIYTILIVIQGRGK